MKKTICSLIFALALFGCQSSTHAPSFIIGASDTTIHWDSAALALRHFTGGFSTSDGLTLFYQGWQPVDSIKAAVCLVHGLAEHSGRYAAYASSLCNAKFAVISFDLRGHGRSMGQRGHFPSIDIVLDDISRLETRAHALYPGKKLFLYGHSLGGNFVINYALRRNSSFSGVIASAPFLRSSAHTPAWKMLLGKVMNVVWPTATMSNGLPVQDVVRDTLVQQAIKNDPMVHDRITAHFMAMFDAGEWALAHADELKMPMLLMHGDADRITSEPASAQFAQKAGTRCTFKVWPGYFHQIHSEPGNQAVVAFVSAWMDSCMR
jgi:alpha-beta hydrolase superfamily lysophospholipase